MSRQKNIRGIIIRKRDFMENDMIITILSEDGIRHELITKGVRSGNSKRKNHIDLMNLVDATLYESNSHIYMQSVVCVSSFMELKKHLDRIMPINILMEIIEKTVLEKDAHPEIYDLLLDTLGSFDQIETKAFFMEMSMTKLAHHLGFLPNFKNCALCHKTIDNDDALWDTKATALYCINCGHDWQSHMPLKYRKALDFFQKASRTECEKIVLQPEELLHLRQFIPTLFLSHIDSPIKSMAMGL